MATTTMAPTALAPPTHDRISFAEPARPRRPSIAATSTTDSSNPDDYIEDWNKTTSEKDSWAYRERRRSNRFSKIDSDMAMQSYEKQARSRSGRRGSSVLGIFQEGVDKKGNSIILSDEDHDDLDPLDEKLLVVPKSPRPAMASVFNIHDDRRLSMSSENSNKRRGSILSLWKTGKDKKGNDQVHSGHEGDDWEEAVSLEGSTNGSAPTSPRLDHRGDRRGSILSIWRQGKDKEGNAVILSGEAHDEDIVVLDENGEPVEVVPASIEKEPPPPRERHGSILSIWTQGKDKEGRSAILSGEEHEGPVPVIPEKVEGPPRGQERRGSMLSMWTEGRERDVTERPGKVILGGFEEDGGEL